MNALNKIHEISKILAASGIERADKEAGLLMCHVLGLGLADLFSLNPELTAEQTLAIDAMVRRREKREPLPYITGTCEFMGMKILVGRGILIPRPETELMAEMAVKAVSSRVPAFSIPSLQILDLCTGSGCLALALARELPQARVCGIDISETALHYARRNAELNGISNVEFLGGHLFGPLLSHPSPDAGEGKGGQMFDLIIANPPYIRTEDIQTLQPEIRDWEPLNALDGGTDGLIFYREIIPRAGNFLKTNGILMLELGAGCADETVSMMKDAGYTDIRLHKDYSAIERIIQGTWTS